MATFGVTSTSGSSDYTTSDYVQVSKAATTPSAGTLNSISVYINGHGAGMTMLCALYADSDGSPRGGIGRRAWFRSMCRKVWGFESLRGHHD